MLMHWPQITYLALMAISIGISLAKHGTSMGTHNIFIRLPASALAIWIVYSGGFFGSHCPMRRLG